MTFDKDGGSAFPKLESLSSRTPSYTTAQSTDGMSLRDYFAVKALQGLVASPRAPLDENGHEFITAENYAALAYAIASAMLLERAKITKS